jgi:tripartite-type tricarboxylate transporter receptor subunit TctC
VTRDSTTFDFRLSTSDFAAGRLVSLKLSEALGRQFVVENRPGANGMIGSELAAKAPKDGYTLMVNGANFVTTPSLYSKVSYDPERDFDPVSLLAHAPNVLVVHPSLPVKSVKELITLARARPGQVNFAGSGSGSTPHLARRASCSCPRPTPCRS